MNALTITDSSRINQLWRWFGVVVWLTASVAIAAHYHARLYSTSIDVGLHGTLVSRLMESSNLPKVDENLGEMATYPRVAHRIAAWVGIEVDSAVEGMQYVADFSVILLWSAIGLSFLKFPRQKRLIAFVALALALLANRHWIGLEIFGNELVATYFFAHFVAQTLAFVLLVVALQMEWRKPDSLAHLIVLGLGASFLASVHLLPSVELLGTLGLLVLLNALGADSASKGYQCLITGGAITLFCLGLTVVNPDFIAMIRLSENNGLMVLKYAQSVRDMAVLAVVVALTSIGLTVLWWRRRREAASYDVLLLKYFGAFGLTVAGLCALQIFLYAGFSKGSEYACFKYATCLQSILVLNLVVLLTQLAKDRAPISIGGPSVFAPTALAAIACASVFSGDNFVQTGKIVAAEREARSFAKSTEKAPPGTHDYAMGISDIGGIGNFLVSRLALGAPSLGTGYDILLGKVPKDAAPVHRILSSTHSEPWDVSKCRRGTSGSLVVLDGACVYAQFTTLKCVDTIEFTSSGALDRASNGFSKPEASGRWSEGSTATLTCTIDGRAPRAVSLQTTALVNESHTQRMIVSVNAGQPKTVDYSAQTPSQRVEIPLANDNSSQLVFKFSFPDAISPHALGMSADARTLGVMIYSISFEQH